MNIRRTKEIKQRFQLPGMLALALEQLLGERQKLNQEKTGMFNKVSDFLNSLTLGTQPNTSLQPVKNMVVC